MCIFDNEPKLYIMKTKLLRLKNSLLIFLCLISSYSYGQGMEDFSNSNASNSYGTASFVGNDDVTWSYVESRNAFNDNNNSGIDLPALMLRRNSDNSSVTSSTINGGIGDFSVKLYKGFTGVGNREVELFVNGVSQGTSTPFDDFNEHLFIINNINISGDIVIEIKNITGKQVIIDDIEWTAYVASTNDLTTEVYAPINQIATQTIIAADVTTETDAEAMFKFTVEDQASGDGLPTNLTRVRLVPGPNNTANWADHLQGFQVMDSNSHTYTPTASITGSEVLLDFASSVSIADGGALDFEIFAYLNTSNIDDGGVLQFTVEGNNSGFQADLSGSDFAPNFLLGDIVGNEMTIDVNATQLSYLQQPSDVIINEVMSPAVEVAYTDVNNNVDIDFSGTGFDVSLTSSASFETSATTTVEAVNGVASFTNLIFNTESTANTLTSTDDSTFIPGALDSSTFDVTAMPNRPSIIISEVTDPNDNYKGRYVEIYNNGSADVDLAAEQIHLAKQANGGNIVSTPLEGILAPNRILIIGNSSNINTNYGFHADVDYGSVNGNGDDGYFLYYDGDESSGILFDAYGVIDVDGSGEAWEYEDSRAVRNNPKTVDANPTWVASEWTVIPAANLVDMTPGALENEYRFNGVWKPRDPFSNAINSDNILVESGTGELNTVSVNNIEVESGASLNVLASAVLSLDGDITNNGVFTFKSDATGTAQLADATGIIVTGDITVERYIPAKRAFRLLSSAVDGQSFADAWQLGTHITGSGGATNGFDETQTNNPSLFTFDNSLPTQTGGAAWESVTSTSDAISAGQGYRLMVRGDRTIDLNEQNPTPTSATLASKGSLIIGDYTPTLAQAAEFYSLIGNPYQAVVDFEALTFTGDIDNSRIYVWDPTLAGENGRGAYVTVDINTNSPSPSSSQANKFIMPGQAFFVQNKSTINQVPGLTFTENAKATSEAQTETFSIVDEFYVNMRLYKQSALQNEETESDALGLRFADYYTTPSSDEDASKLANPDENFAVANNKFTSIDNRAFPMENEEIQLFVSGYGEENYVIQFAMNHKPEDLKVILNDTYTGNSLEISDTGNYTFNVDSNIPESIANDRFYISFENVTMGTTQPELANAIRLYPNPTKGLLTVDVNDYDVEQLRLYSIQGQELGSMTLSENNTLNVSHLGIGVYIMKIFTNQGTSVLKFIKK